MCSTRLIQCAAVMQDTLSVPSSSKMSSDRKEPAGPLAGFPFWSKSYAEFVMDKELWRWKSATVGEPGEPDLRRRYRKTGP
jgi:hypothetical protein